LLRVVICFGAALSRPLGFSLIGVWVLVRQGVAKTKTPLPRRPAAP